MARIIILFVLVALLVWALKRSLITKKPTHPKASKNASEKMLPCSRCGVHVPESETTLIDQKVVCKNPNCKP